MKNWVLNIIRTVNTHHTGAYAAQAAYFFVLSLIPIFLLLITMVQYTPVTMNDVMELVLPVFPDTVSPLIRSVIVQVYTKSNGFIPFTLLVALWSAGKGVLSVTYGLNCIYDNIETRNYFYLRFRACFYTVLFLIAIMLSLVLSVFGNSLSAVVYEHIPFMSKVMNFIIRIRTCLTLVVLTFSGIWYISFCQTGPTVERQHCGSSFREHFLQHRDGFCFHSSFQSTWIFLQVLQVCMAVLRRSY